MGKGRRTTTGEVTMHQMPHRLNHVQFNSKVDAIKEIAGQDWLRQPKLQQQLIEFMRDEDSRIRVIAMQQVASREYWQKQGLEVPFVDKVNHNYLIRITDQQARLIEPLLDEMVHQTHSDQPYHSRDWAIIFLGYLSPDYPPVEQAFIEALDEDSKSSRAHALTALKCLPRIADSTIEVLAKMLEQQEREYDWSYVAGSLTAHYANQSRWPEIISLLHHSEPIVRFGAINGLSLEAARQDRVRMHLLSCLGDQSSMVALAAIEKLQEIGEKSQPFQAALGWLRWNVPGRSSWLRRVASWALEELVEQSEH